MKYTPEEKARIEMLLKLFGYYIEKNKHFEVVYSSKLGFISFILHNEKIIEHKRLEDADELLDNLFFEILSDVRDLHLGERENSWGASLAEVDETRRRIESFLLQIDNPKELAYCMNALNNFLSVRK